jgi:hypothetical protein
MNLLNKDVMHLNVKSCPTIILYISSQKLGPLKLYQNNSTCLCCGCYQFWF